MIYLLGLYCCLAFTIKRTFTFLYVLMLFYIFIIFLFTKCSNEILNLAYVFLTYSVTISWWSADP